MTTSSGMDCAPKRAARLGTASTSTLTIFKAPACWLAKSCRTGAIIRQGPHQAAQKATTTGTEAAVSEANVSAPASTTQGSADLHFGQRGLPRGIGATRVPAPHVGRLMLT